MVRILIVEDDPTARKIACAALQRFGHELLVAASAAEARHVLEALPRDEELCLVIDIVLANENGIALAHEVIASGRPARILLVSGFTDDIVLSDPLVAAHVSFLPKPFTSAELVAALDAVCPL